MLVNLKPRSIARLSERSESWLETLAETRGDGDKIANNMPHSQSTYTRFGVKKSKLFGRRPAAAFRSAHTTSRNWDLINQLPLRELQSRILRLSCSELKLSQRLRFRNSIQGRGRNVPGFVGIPSWTRELSCRVQLLVTFRVL